MNHLPQYQIPVPVERLTRESLVDLLTRTEKRINTDAVMAIERLFHLIPEGELPGYGLFLGPLAGSLVDFDWIAPGARVLIPRGASIRSTNERPSKARRNHIVTVHRAYAGFIHEPDIRPAHIVWAGSGGYWREADLDDIFALGGGHE
ncbi:hypothetical protein [Thioalkalivibrio sp. ALE16]|uniref:hypothetical protein n=1 Tax=Thioalkalivibrio sp. ALE16 TaxID=1158172 RepID=UPI00036EF5AD|nr:hypothetical protein [Thioalkalivibrio sp. ALE16]